MEQNASIWTGGNNGLETIHGDILLDHGLIKQIGHIPMDKYSVRSAHIVNANGKWVSPG